MKKGIKNRARDEFSRRNPSSFILILVREGMLFILVVGLELLQKTFLLLQRTNKTNAERKQGEKINLIQKKAESHEKEKIKKFLK